MCFVSTPKIPRAPAAPQVPPAPEKTATAPEQRAGEAVRKLLGARLGTSQLQIPRVNLPY